MRAEQVEFHTQPGVVAPEPSPIGDYAGDPEGREDIEKRLVRRGHQGNHQDSREDDEAGDEGDAIMPAPDRGELLSFQGEDVCS